MTDMLSMMSQPEAEAVKKALVRKLSLIHI